MSITRNDSIPLAQPDTQSDGDYDSNFSSSAAAGSSVADPDSYSTPIRNVQSITTPNAPPNPERPVFERISSQSRARRRLSIVEPPLVKRTNSTLDLRSLLEHQDDESKFNSVSITETGVHFKEVHSTKPPAENTSTPVANKTEKVSHKKHTSATDAEIQELCSNKYLTPERQKSNNTKVSNRCITPVPFDVPKKRKNIHITPKNKDTHKSFKKMRTVESSALFDQKKD